MPAAPTLPLQPVVPGHASTHSDFDYEEIASFMSERLVEDLAGPVADRVADRVAAAITDRLTANSGAGPVRATRERKRRERCRLVQTRITYLLKKGLHVSKLEDIGSDRQPNELDLDHDNEAPWSIDWTVGPDHLSNCNVVDNWVGEVLRDKERQMIRLHRKGRIMDDQFTDNFVRSLLPHTWDTVRKSIKNHQDASGRRAQRQKEAKERSKRKERRRELALQRSEAAEGRTWHGKPIPSGFFNPEYHSDSENDPAPDLWGIHPPISPARYQELRRGADYEMLTPGWRSEDSKGNRPQGCRYYHSTSRHFDMDDIPDGVPRCMIKDDVYNDTMDEDKRALVGATPDGW
ncbi:hypothetical protein AG1IA_03816 [Rhizoctonia solani AG-1 IA]|uniref:Uncharacterized protein n=1 Tax=Thanatephorus cucumeris (strain AG1-IA) TaxID=983506 RepID=L8WZ99_THACA|nr:hypothetical protein AG1IA_03816 [Rhizoctonia solani AG-1 IA]